MGDGIALTDLGQTLTSGERAYGCPHMAQWWPVFTRLQILRGRIKACLDIVQAYGWSDKSGGTHGQGTAVDVTQTDAGIVADAREAGARGTWCRGKRWGQASMGDHIHLALDCPCASGSDYQIGAADDGYLATEEGQSRLKGIQEAAEPHPTSTTSLRAEAQLFQKCSSEGMKSDFGVSSQGSSSRKMTFFPGGQVSRKVISCWKAENQFSGVSRCNERGACRSKAAWKFANCCSFVTLALSVCAHLSSVIYIIHVQIVCSSGQHVTRWSSVLTRVASIAFFFF